LNLCAKRRDVNGVIAMSYPLVEYWLRLKKITCREDIEDIQQDVAMEIWKRFTVGTEIIQDPFSLELEAMTQVKTLLHLHLFNNGQVYVEGLCN